MSVLITHPGRQHSHQAALALAEEGLLAGYWSGVPSHRDHLRNVPEWLRDRIRYATVDLPSHLARWLPLATGLRKISYEMPSRGAAVLDFAACRVFDHHVSTRMKKGKWESRPKAILACEISALSSFRLGKRLGLSVWLDAPSLHHTAQDQLHGTLDSPALHRRIVYIKNEEIAMADAIITVSALARRTYVDAGVPSAKVHCVPLGADIAMFRPSSEAPSRNAVRFLFAGAQIRRKAFDLVVLAFEQVALLDLGAELRVVGPRGDVPICVGPTVRDRISWGGSVTQAELVREFQNADLLVLPSRNDSYGMVVAEALATGIPVIVSDMVGASELVRQGENGWIVPAGNLAALTERMRHAARNIRVVRGMRDACRWSVAGATWEAYRARFGELVRKLIADRVRP